METYSVELDASLALHFEVTRKVLPGRADGHPPRLIAYALFLIQTIFYCLFYANRFSHVVIGDLVLFPAALCCRIRAPRQKRLVVVYGLDLVYFKRKGLLPSIYGAYFALFRGFQATFDAIVAISGYTAELARGAGLKAVHVVTPSLPRTALTEGADQTTTSIPDAFMHGTSRKILQFGRVVPRKGSAWFATNVVPLLPDDVEFFVVGASYDSSVLEVLHSSPRTSYLGLQPPEVLAEMIKHADIVVMPNIVPPSDSADVEGFGLVAVEAASLGGVLVASRVQGLADAVIDGVTGTLIEPENPEIWAATIKHLLNEPLETTETRRSTARSETRTAFSKERMGDALLALF
jgi:phosphatidylinositol alpha-1,6-mannosyltransferase